MKDPTANNALHGVTLEMMITRLVDQYGWEELGHRIPARCFTFEPSLKSSLTFVRKTPWARKKVEWLYVKTFGAAQKVDPKPDAPAA